MTTGSGQDLRRALDAALAGVASPDVARAAGRLIGRYREGPATTGPILRSALDAAAYAAYRMPATYAATRSALRSFAELAPGFLPSTQLDVGGGTGAALWAAAGIWPSLEVVTVIEQVDVVAALGQRLAGGAASAAVRRAVWRRGTVGPDAALPAADLVTMSYVLGELPPGSRDGTVRRLAETGAVVALIEPGTPDGYDRVVTARDLLIGLGMTIVAPCPHDRACPIPRGRDWCHFSARVSRSPLHRRTKGATVGFEDEKFSYVVASAGRWPQAGNRVVRRPQQRKGLVSLPLCAAGGELAAETVSRRQGDVYRDARHATWGDAWPPVSGAGGDVTAAPAGGGSA